MNFLCILQVLAIVFVLKMHLLIHLFILNKLWTRRIKSGNCRDLCASYFKTQNTVCSTAG
jgi:hypothetical protein